MQRMKIRPAVRVTRNDLTIEDDGLGGECAHRVRNRRVPFGEVGAVLGKDRNVLAVLMQLHAVAVEFYLVQPPRTGWRLLAQGCPRREDEWGATQHGTNV